MYIDPSISWPMHGTNPWVLCYSDDDDNDDDNNNDYDDGMAWYS